MSTDAPNVSPDTDAPTLSDASSDGRKNRVKKQVYDVPEEKLSWPWNPAHQRWDLRFSKFKPDDFQSLEEFEGWECYEYHEFRILRIEEKAAEAIAPIRAEQEVIRIKLEKSKEICDSLGITDKAQKSAIADALGFANAAEKSGVSYEQMLNALQMLQETKGDGSDE